MNSVQMHLALTHVPVILSFLGLVMLIIALIIRSPFLTNTSYVLIAIAGLAAIPVFLTGEGTEEAVENIPGISGAIIEKHEQLAKLAIISIATGGMLALTALIFSKWFFATVMLRYVVLALALVSGVLMAQTAHLGGQIRHSEINRNSAFTSELAASENGSQGNENPEKDDD